MTDRKDMPDDFDLDALRAVAGRAAPRPDPAIRAAHLDLARRNFDALQGSRDPSRLNPEGPRRGLWIGVTDMISRMTGKGALTLTTAIVACGVIFMTPVGQDLWQGWQRQPAWVNPDPAPGPRPAPDLTAQTADPFADPTAAEDRTRDPAPEAGPGETAGTPADPVATVQEAVPETNAAGPAPQTAETAPADFAEQEAPAAEADAGGITFTGEVTLGYNDMQAQNVVPSAPPPAARNVAPETAMGGMAFDGIVAPAPMVADPMPIPLPDTEEFANEDENPLRIVAEEPVSTFSVDVDTASWSLVRQSLNRGVLPPADAVRVEELINYFPYDYAAPEADDAAPFRPNVTVMPTPWNPDTQLVVLGLQGEMPAVEDRPPLNLVFLIDTSGSMEDANKLPLLKASFRLMLGELRPEDQVAIVTYAGSAGLVLPPTPAGESATILKALDNLSAGGSTAGQAGLAQAYATAAEMAGEGEVTRVILATDGDFNVGMSAVGDLEDYIADQRDTGVFLSVLGFGRGNLDDATMQALAQNGNGTAAYIDTLAEAQKVLVDQLTGALFPIASDVKVQVEWNPAVVAEYRLIGYETRALNREDFNNDRVDAGDLGAGHNVTAIYEITPVGSPAVMVDPLRYGEAQVTPASNSEEIGFLRLRWKEPGSDTSDLVETPILPGGPVGDEAEFAAAIAGFGQLLRGSDWLGDWSWDEAIALAAANRGTDGYGYRTEAVNLMRIAASLSVQ